MDIIFPKLANRLLGAKFKIVGSYNTSNDILLAMEREKVHGVCGVGWSLLKLQKWELLEQRKINILFKLAIERASVLPKVPLVHELAARASSKSRAREATFWLRAL